MTNFSASDFICASVQCEDDTGCSISADVLIGHYGKNGEGEVFLAQGEYRVQIPLAQVPDLIKALKRTQVMALEAMATKPTVSGGA